MTVKPLHGQVELLKALTLFDTQAAEASAFAMSSDAMHWAQYAEFTSHWSAYVGCHSCGKVVQYLPNIESPIANRTVIALNAVRILCLFRRHAAVDCGGVPNSGPTTQSYHI